MNRHVFIPLLLFVCIQAIASWSPVIHNFAPRDYQGGAQNWSIATQHNGWIYAANNYGLLEYDGCQWHLYGLSNSTAVRCVTIGDDGKVYAGGRNQYGYFTPDGFGQMQYTSLSDSLPATNRNFGEVWRIVDHHGDLYVQTRQLLICHTADQVQVIDPGSIIEAIAVVNGSLYVATQQDLRILVGNHLHILSGSDVLRNMTISQMIDLNGNLLIATDCNGLFLYDGEQIRPFYTDADALLRQYQIYTLTTHNNYLVIGSVQRGLILTSIDGHGCSQITRDNGLQNNTVLSLCIDHNQHLWIGLDRGLSRLCISQDVFFLQDKEDYGSGYAYCIYDGESYLGTNQGLYYQSNSQSSLHFIDGSQGQVWSLDTIAGTLFCSHNKGLYSVQDKRLSLLITEGCWHVRRLSATEAIAGTYTGFYYLHLNGHQWQVERLNGFSETALYFSIDGHRILVRGSQGICAFDIDLSQHRLVPHPIAADEYQIDDLGYIQHSATPLKHPYAWNYLSSQHLLIDGFYNCFTTSDSIEVVGSIDGFYRFLPHTSASAVQQLYIRRVTITSPFHQDIYGEGYQYATRAIDLSPGVYSLDVTFSGNNTMEVSPLFATRLWPIEKEFSELQAVSSRQLTGLQPGHYRLDVLMQDGLSEQVSERTMEITIRYPFYQRWWAWCGYGLLFIALVWFILYRVRQYEQNRRDRIQQENNIELQRQQLHILELEQEQNKTKLKTKSQELSHMLLTEVNRKEWNQDVLVEVRRIVDLLHKEHYDEARTRVAVLQNKLVRNAETTLDWKRFEVNFDIIHDQFIAKLKERYPWMSKAERQLCIYIKMGLLTKEIAPLMNISVRGVEMLRYRLRQKMNLPESDNLRKYLD